jgi:predicted AAA+ superfamily ATPase
MIVRHLSHTLVQQLGKGKAIVLLGARQTGKTTLLHQLFDAQPKVLWLNGDESDVQAMFENPSSTRFKALFAAYDTVVLDEAQRIRDVGIKLKLITDHVKSIQLAASGSASLDLADMVREPLTGRLRESMLYPISFGEMVDHHGLIEEKRLLPHRLIFGYYPEVVTSKGEEREVLRSISDSYLFKDILMWERIKKPDKLVKLLQALAIQTGSQVSFHELGRLVGLDNQTVEKYVQILERCYVIYRLPSFSRNLRSELKTTRKIYFVDNGIRNALIANFNPPALRQDAGALWENFLMSERLKYTHYSRMWVNRFFWRTQNQLEVDYVEERDGLLHAYEFKWNPRSAARVPASFRKAYPEAEFNVISMENVGDFLLTK